MEKTKQLIQTILSITKDSCENECGRRLRCLGQQCAIFRIREAIEKTSNDVNKEISEAESLAQQVAASKEAEKAIKLGDNASLYHALKYGGKKNGR